MRFFLWGEHVIRDDAIVAIAPAEEGRKTKVWTAGQSAVDGAFLCDIEFEEAKADWIGEEDDDADGELQE